MKNKIESFLSTLDRSPNTIRTYRNALNVFTYTVGKNADLTVENFTAFLASIKHLKTTTKNLYKTAVIRFYTFHKAADYNELKEISHHYIKKIGITLPDFNEELIEKLITHCLTLRGDLISLRDKAFVLACADGGLRIFEASKLKRGQIDWEHRFALITGKGDKMARVKFKPRAIAAMKAYLSARDKVLESNQLMSDQPLFARHDKMASKKLLPVSDSGTGMREAIKMRMEEAGILRDKVRIHDFRHLFITKHYRLEKDILKTRNAARQASVVTTQRYTHLQDERDEFYEE